MELEGKPAMPSTLICSSPVEHTLEVLQERLVFAEEETLKLSKQLSQYRFQRVPAEKPDIEKHKSPKDEAIGTKSNNFNSVVTRLCQTESIIETLREGMKSIELEGHTTKSQLLQEKQQLQESYGKQTKELITELKNYKQKFSSYAEAKTALEKQNEKLKKEVSKRIDTQRQLTEKLKEKDIELCKYQERIFELSKESNKHENSEKDRAEHHSMLLKKVSELEKVVETEQINVSKLDERCSSLKNDALLARQEFEKEFNDRLRLENLLSMQEEDFEISNKKIQELLAELEEVKNQCSGHLDNLQISTSKRDQLTTTLDGATVENKKLREALKSTITDKNALIENNKKTLVREQAKSESVLQQQSKVLDSAKETFLGQIESLRKHVEELEEGNISLKNQLNVFTVRMGENDFKMKMMEQNHISDSNHLQAQLKSEKQMKDELVSKIHELEQKLKDATEENERISTSSNCFANDIQVVKKKYDKLEEEHRKVTEKLSWMTINQDSSTLINKKLSEMMNEKRNLAYEKGALQNKMKKMQEEMEALHQVQEKNDEIRSTCSRLERDVKDKVNCNNKLETVIKDNTAELKMLTNEVEKERAKTQELVSRYKKLEKETCLINENNDQLTHQLQDIIATSQTEIERLTTRLSSHHKERQDIGANFGSLMSTNDHLQKELEFLQESLGKKDSELMSLAEERERSTRVIQEMKIELEKMTTCLDTMDMEHKIKVDEMSAKLQTKVESEKESRLSIEKYKKKIKTLKEEFSRLDERMKHKENEFKKSIKSKEQNLTDAQGSQQKETAKMKITHRKEINKLKSNIETIKEEQSKKEKEFEHRLHFMDKLSHQVEDLDKGKKLYVEKNAKQAALLESFMGQVVELQSELSTIMEEHNETIQEKENLIEEEKQKRKEVIKKYKALLRNQARNEIEEAKHPMVRLQKNSNDSHKLLDDQLLEEKLDTENILRRYQKHIDQEGDRMRQIQENMNDFKRIPRHRKNSPKS